ncbi:MAG: beta-N-acetylhexosaminidase [Gammaproteobacteria bacterium RIFCSPHIGHO2_12_FULL_38_14]|nr:MAG: beta-N-acetylhexosaminidase [Gammaproteobacteria bacterium RIFCSPHIGHO2_12_FULL_38_14]
MHNNIGCFVVDLLGHELSQEEKELLAHPLVGGVIFFSRNYVSRQQIKTLTESIRAIRKQPFLLMVDQEGGRVQRFINEFSVLPAPSVWGKMVDEGKYTKAHEQAKYYGALMASEILSVGIDLSFAPVLDLNKNMNQVIGERAFHAHPDRVTSLARAYLSGMHDAGMAGTGKHFPGHGSVTKDSHTEIPIDGRPLTDIFQSDLLPFRKLIQEGLPAVMAAHILFPLVDEKPASFSRIWLHNILREQLKFKGSLFSDDLNMAGANISSYHPDRVIAARDAGCDFTLLCNNHEGVIQVLDALPHQKYQVDIEKWGNLKGGKIYESC